jgi:hypothetical protein
MNNDAAAFSNHEIESFLNGKQINAHNCVIPIEFIEQYNYNLNQVFGDRFFTVLFLKGLTIGHFVLLSHLTTDEGEEYIEYFDSTGQPVPDIVQEFGKRNNLFVTWTANMLQKPGTYTCAKWVIARILSLPTALMKFIAIFGTHENFSPDELVDSLLILKK